MGYHCALYKHLTHYYMGPNQKTEIFYRSAKATMIYFNSNINPLLKIKYPGKCKIRVGSRSTGVNKDSHRQTETFKYSTFSNYDSLSVISLTQSFSTSSELGSSHGEEGVSWQCLVSSFTLPSPPPPPASQRWPAFKMT